MWMGFRVSRIRLHTPKLLTPGIKASFDQLSREILHPNSLKWFQNLAMLEPRTLKT